MDSKKNHFDNKGNVLFTNASYTRGYKATNERPIQQLNLYLYYKHLIPCLSCWHFKFSYQIFLLAICEMHNRWSYPVYWKRNKCLFLKCCKYVYIYIFICVLRVYRYYMHEVFIIILNFLIVWKFVIVRKKLCSKMLWEQVKEKLIKDGCMLKSEKSILLYHYRTSYVQCTV